jgi:hypothetical protein
MAAFVLACAAVAPAAGPQPIADPLWKAFPLDTDPPATATSTSPAPSARTAPAAPARTSPAAPIIAQQPATSAPPAALEPPGPNGPPAAITMIFFGSLAGASLLVVAALMRRRAGRRRALGPVTCEITWSPVSEGGAFSATTQENGDVPQLVAASRRFERRTPGPPDQDWASRQAYAELVRLLMAEGWEPYGRGRAWWEMRLRRAPKPGTPREAIHG